MEGNPHHGGRSRGFTLIELLVVIVIISIMSAMIVAQMHGTFQDAILRSTGRELAGAFSAASSRAVALNRPLRVRLDRAAHRYLIERGTRGGDNFIPVRDIPDGQGTLDARITIEVREPGLDAPDDAGTPPEDSGNADNVLSKPPKEAVTFYPDGTADDRQIELTDPDGFGLALRINPITSRVQIAAMPHK